MLKGIGAPELIIILLIVLVIFGAGRLPEIGGAIGKSIRNFKRESSAEGDGKEADETKVKEEAQVKSQSNNSNHLTH